MTTRCHVIKENILLSLKLILESPNALQTEKRKNLIKKLRQIEKQDYSWERYIEERISDYEPNEYSGYPGRKA